VRIRRLTPYLSRGNFRWRNTPGTQWLVRQAREFPVGEHDDAIDALEQALRLAIDLSYGTHR
jgi:predicted phage terminase large subunit-like protein